MRGHRSDERRPSAGLAWPRAGRSIADFQYLLTRPVAVVGGNRIPFARSNTVYANASNQDMLTAAIDGLVARFGLEGERLGEVAAGAVLKHPRDFNLTREAVLGTTLDPHTPAFDLQRACGTSLETAIIVGMKIALGQIDSGIAAGVDTARDAPIGVSEGLRKLMLRSARGRSLGERLTPWLEREWQNERQAWLDGGTRRGSSRVATRVAKAAFPRRAARVSDPMSGFFIAGDQMEMSTSSNGAYGAVMANRYNLRALPQEDVIDD